MQRGCRRAPRACASQRRPRRLDAVDLGGKGDSGPQERIDVGPCESGTRELGDRALSRCAELELKLSRLARRDVVQRALPHLRAVAVGAQHSPVGEPDDPPLGAEHPVLELGRLGVAEERLLLTPERTPAIIGVHPRGPEVRVLCQLLRRDPEKVFDPRRYVAKAGLAPMLGQIDDRRKLLEQVAEV